MKKLLFVLFLVFVGASIYAQQYNGLVRDDNKTEFNIDKSYKTIIFVVGNQDLTESEIKNALDSEIELFSFEFNMNSRECKIRTDVSVTKEEIVPIMSSSNFKMSNYYEKVNLLIKNANVSQEKIAKQYAIRQVDNLMLSEEYSDYPKLKGSTQEDINEYARQKEEWIRKNPEKYKKLIIEQPLTEEEKALIKSK